MTQAMPRGGQSFVRIRCAPLRVWLVALTALALAACSSTGGAGQAGGDSSSGGGAANSGTSAGTNDAGADGSGGGEPASTTDAGADAPGGGSGGHDGSATGHGDGGASPGDSDVPSKSDDAGEASSGSEGGAVGPFACSLVIGNTTTQQWFDGGFLTYAGIDATHFEMFFVGHHYVDAWADPADPAWSTGLDNGHMCAAGTTTPDRVIFIATKAPPYPSVSFYQTNMTAIVNDIKAKYPTAKRIELTTLIRAPNNVPCSGTVASSEQIVPPAEDQGIAATAALFQGLVVALPPMFVPTCSDFVSGMPQYTTAGAMDVANVYGKYYAANP